jgi:hypothetical protein
MRTDRGREMTTIGRFAIGAIAAVALAAAAGCRREPTTASRSAAAYDEAVKKGEPLEAGDGHDHDGHAPSAAGEPAETSESAHAGHAAAGAPAGDGRGHADHAATGRAGMDHSAMDHDHAAPSRDGRSHGPAAHTGHSATTAAAPGAAGHADHAGMQGAPSGGTGHQAHGAPPQARSASGPPEAAPMTEHPAMGHAPGPVPAPSPEPGSKAAVPGQPAETLRNDTLDAPAATAVRDAARARDAASSGHAMTHGTYRHVDAGREDVTITSPVGPNRRGSAPIVPAADPHAGHAMPAPAPPADPHAGHAMPAPRPSPSPSPEPRR